MTKSQFNYYPDDLSSKSTRFIVAGCDECGHLIGKNGRIRKRDLIYMRERNPDNKDLCTKCYLDYINPFRIREVCIRVIKEKYEQLGRAPTRNEIPIGCYVAVTRHHGGYENFLEELNLPPNSKHKGYWKDFENVKKELLPLCRIYNGMPPSKWLSNNGYSSLVSSIFKYHGGIVSISKKLNYPIQYYDTASDGHYVFSWFEKQVDDILFTFNIPHKREPQIAHNDKRRGDFLVSNIYIECCGVDPERIYNDLRKIEYLKNLRKKINLYKEAQKPVIILYPKDFKDDCSGVFNKLTNILDSSKYKPSEIEIKNVILPSTKWAEWNFYEEKVKEMIDINNGRFPDARTAEKLGYSTIFHYASKFYGGISQVKRKLGYGVNKMGSHYWRNIKNVKKQFLPVCQKLGYFPTVQMIRKHEYGMIDCVTALYEYYGSLKNVANLLGYKSKDRKKSDFENPDYFYKELYKYVLDAKSDLRNRKFPSPKYFRQNNGHTLITWIYKKYGKGKNKMMYVKNELYKQYPELNNVM